jgi:hypothetical protein
LGVALKDDWPNTGRLAVAAAFKPNAEGWPAKAENPPADPLVLPVAVAAAPLNADCGAGAPKEGWPKADVDPVPEPNAPLAGFMKDDAGCET